MSDVPNLDAMDVDDLIKFGNDHARLALYAKLKAHAMIMRKTGKIADALNAEKECDQIYKSLPQCLRW